MGSVVVLLIIVVASLICVRVGAIALELITVPHGQDTLKAGDTVICYGDMKTVQELFAEGIDQSV
ncbi:MAG: hypothetical protein WA133_10705 [Syntrophales bacterium]